MSKEHRCKQVSKEHRCKQMSKEHRASSTDAAQAWHSYQNCAEKPESKQACAVHLMIDLHCDHNREESPYSESSLHCAPDCDH